jgi:predicted PurR-regulated permease PerM
MTGPAPADRPDRASDRLRRTSDIVLRVGVLIAAVLLVLMTLWWLRVVTLPIFIAVLLCTALAPPVVSLERRGVPTLLATWLVFLGFFAALAAVLLLALPPTVDELGGLSDAVGDASSEVEDWLVDGPLQLDRQDVEAYTEHPFDRLQELVERSSFSLSRGARLAGEITAGALLSLVLTFLFLKDGRRFQHAVLDRLPPQHAGLIGAASSQAWDAFGGFLRGAATLGVIEGAVIGTTVRLVGGSLSIPIAVLTFFGAFFPIVGAIAAGVLATLVTFATAGTVPAIIVGVVVLVVQQVDNDLLAPFVYGRAVELHPAAVLIALAVGASLGGIAGAFIAVPILSALLGAGRIVWQHRDAVGPQAPRPGPPPVDEAVPDRGERPG